MPKYLYPHEIRATFTTLYLLVDGTTVPRKGTYLVIKDCKCGRPLVHEREVKFQEKVGTCFSCTTGNPLDFCIRTRGCCVYPDRVDDEVLIRRRISPTSEIRTRRTIYGMYEVHWTYDPVEVYFQIGERALTI